RRIQMLVLENPDVADKQVIIVGNRDTEGIPAYFHSSHNSGKVVRISRGQAVTGNVDLGRVDHVCYKRALIHDVKESPVWTYRQAAGKAVPKFSGRRRQRVHGAGQSMRWGVQVHQRDDTTCGGITNPNQTIFPA